MEKLQNLEYNNFIELLDYLESLCDSDIPEERELFVEEKIQNFFPELDAVQELELSYIVKTRNKEAFELFKGGYPDIMIDTTGRSTPESKDYWQLVENSLESIYNFAIQELESAKFIDKSFNKVNTQVYNAKTLSCLKNMEALKKDNYLLHRKLFIDSNRKVSAKEFKRAEDELKSIGLDASAFLISVVRYAHKTKDVFIFLDHLFKRINILASDVNLKSKASREFLSNIKLVIDKNNKLYEK
jgi:hypothetical protein